MGDFLTIAGAVLIVIGLYQLATSPQKSVRAAWRGRGPGIAFFVYGVIIANIGLILNKP